MALGLDARATFMAVVKGDVSDAVSSFNRLGNSVERSTRGATSNIDRFRRLGRGAMSEVRANAGTLATAGAAALVTFGISAANSFASAAKAAKDLSRATGFTVEEASRWIAISDDYGVGADTLATALGRITKELDSPKFAKYGIATRDAAGEARSANAIFLDVLSVLNETPNASERARIGAELIGRGWQGLAPILGHTREEYEAMLAAVQDEQVFTEGEAAKAEKYNLAVDNIGDAFQELTLATGEALLGLTPLIDVMAELVRQGTVLFDLLGLADTTDKTYARFATRLQDTADSAIGTSIAFGEFTTDLIENRNMVNQISQMVDMSGMTEAEKNIYLMTEAVRTLATESPTAAAQTVSALEDVMMAAARGNPGAKAFVEGWGLTIPVLSDLKAIAGAASESVDGLAGATEEAAAEQEENRLRLEAANQAYQDQIDLIDELYGNQRDAIERQRDYTDSQKELYEVFGDTTATLDEQLDAVIQMSEEFGTLTGAALDSRDGTLRQIESLDTFLSTIDPSSPLYQAIKEYRDILAEIPTNVDTLLRLNLVAGKLVTNEGDTIGVRALLGETEERAMGGPVSAGSPYLVGERGPELIVPSTSGTVIPNGALGGTTILNVTVTNPVASGEQLANELAAYTRRNGSAWLSGAR